MIRFLHSLFGLCCKKSTVGPSMRVRQSVLVAIVAIGTLPDTVRGQFLETFDRPGEYFQLWRHDCRARVTRPSQVEPGVETLEVAFGNGTHAQLVLPIDPCAVVDDLTASMRIRCGHDGLSIAFRVIFPRSTHPATQDPLFCLIFGSPTEGKGQWSVSTVKNMTRELESQKRLLLARYRGEVDLSDPYVDAIVLEVYRFPGTTRLQIDDLQIEGMIPPDVLREEGRDTNRGVPRNRDPLVQLQQIQNTVPRWVQYRGESLDYLQTLGFNGIVSNRADDTLIAEQAARTGIAVVASLPEKVPDATALESYQHVSAWMLGWELNESTLETTRRQIGRLSRFPSDLLRPTIGEAMELYGPYSRLTDWLAVPTPHTTRVRSSIESDQIMLSESRSLAGRSHRLTSIATQMSSEWSEQKTLLQQSIGGDSVTLPDFDPLQARLAVYRSMMQGTRGWIFRSSGPLDRGDPTSLARAKGFETINQEIELFAPWIQANQQPWRPVNTDSQNYRAAVLTTPNSQLVLAVTSGAMDQVCAIAPLVDRLRITIPTVGQVRNVYRVTHGQLETLRAEQKSDGIHVVIENPGLTEQIVTVVDPKPAEYLREQLVRKAAPLMESRIESSELVVQLAQMIAIDQRLRGDDDAWELIRRSQVAHREAIDAMSKSNLSRALAAADRSLILAQRVIRNSWEEAVSQFSSFQSSPLVASPLSLPLHWRLHHVLEGRPWQPLAIPGIDQRDWGALQQRGWSVDQRLQELVTSSVSIDGSTVGKPVMVLESNRATQQPIPTGYAGASMRVTSARIIAPLGSLVHIQGNVEITSPVDETQSGLLISDSLGGESLGQLISSADTSQDSWRKFGLFRFVTHPDGFQLFLETRGEMRARIADLQAEFIMPTRNANLPIRELAEGETPQTEPN